MVRATELLNAESAPAASGRLNARVVNWAQMYDCYGDADRVPELLARAEREDDAEAWDELGYRLILECDLVFPAGFAALPRLVCLASRSARARGYQATKQPPKQEEPCLILH